MLLDVSVDKAIKEVVEGMLLQIIGSRDGLTGEELLRMQHDGGMIMLEERNLSSRFEISLFF